MLIAALMSATALAGSDPSMLEQVGTCQSGAQLIRYDVQRQPGGGDPGYLARLRAVEDAATRRLPLVDDGSLSSAQLMALNEAIVARVQAMSDDDHDGLVTDCEVLLGLDD